MSTTYPLIPRSRPKGSRSRSSRRSMRYTISISIAVVVGFIGLVIASIALAKLNGIFISRGVIKSDKCVIGKYDTFGDEFMMGFATAAYQNEEESTTADWYTYAQNGGIILGPFPTPGVGNKFYSNYNETLDRAAALGANTFRFSLAWDRIEPTEGTYVVEEILHYVQVAKAIRDRGMTPVLVIVHFVLPQWLDAKYPAFGDGPWLHLETTDAFLNFANVVIPYFVNDVDIYLTHNEPFIVSSAGYTISFFPPGKIYDLSLNSFITAAELQVIAHAKVYDAIHALYDAVEKPVKVAFSDSMVWTSERYWGEAAKQNPEYLTIRKYFQIAFCTQMAMTGRAYNASNPSVLTTLDAKWGYGWSEQSTYKMDFIAIQTYSAALEFIYNPDLLPYSAKGYCRNQFFGFLPPAIDFICDNSYLTEPSLPFHKNGRVNPYAAFENLVRELWQRYELPILVSETGIGGNKNAEFEDQPRITALRSATMAKSMRILRKLYVQDGIDLMGYLQWTIDDNYEWFDTYTANFGLYNVSGRETGDLVFQPRESNVNMYKEIATTGCIPNVRIYANAPAPPVSFSKKDNTVRIGTISIEVERIGEQFMNTIHECQAETGTHSEKCQYLLTQYQDAFKA